MIANDADVAENGRMRFEIVSTAAARRDGASFVIDAGTGSIATAARLDREAQRSYSFQVGSLSGLSYFFSFVFFFYLLL